MEFCYEVFHTRLSSRLAPFVPFSAALVCFCTAPCQTNQSLWATCLHPRLWERCTKNQWRKRHQNLWKHWTQLPTSWNANKNNVTSECKGWRIFFWQMCETNTGVGQKTKENVLYRGWLRQRCMNRHVLSRSTSNLMAVMSTLFRCRARYVRNYYNY